jgi:hypothetical protein
MSVWDKGQGGQATAGSVMQSCRWILSHHEMVKMNVNIFSEESYALKKKSIYLS